MGAKALAIWGLSVYAMIPLVLGLLVVSWRTFLVVKGERLANSFAADGSDLGAFSTRLNAAYNNALLNLPVFATLVITALIADKAILIAWLLPYVLGARLIQSVVHLISTSHMAVAVRGVAFIVQLVILTYWAIRLLRLAL